MAPFSEIGAPFRNTAHPVTLRLVTGSFANQTFLESQIEVFSHRPLAHLASISNRAVDEHALVPLQRQTW